MWASQLYAVHTIMFTVIFLLVYLYVTEASGSYTGFWYGGNRRPVTDYVSVPYVNMTVRINRSIYDGPGENLVFDPYSDNNSSDLYVGPTITRQTFDTQFILDMNYALGVEVERVYIVHIAKGDVHFSWEANSVLVHFIFLERNHTNGRTILELVADLTNQIQTKGTKIYSGTKVTRDIDLTYGLIVDGWDVSLRLYYAIDIVGKDAVKDGYYLNQGGMGICDDAIGALQYETYCEFERFFEDDVSHALNISYYRVQIMFIKTAALDQVYVYFRINPPKPTAGLKELTVTDAVAYLTIQVQDRHSALYGGNVTVRVDSLWGVSGNAPMKRNMEATFTKKYYDFDPSRLSSPTRMSLLTSYDRCKMNHRCNWGVYEIDQFTNDVRYYAQIFERGELHGINAFLDFEDWRLGSRGFSWTGQIPPSARGRSSLTRARASDGVIQGAHFSPFDQRALGPDIPCFLKERNQGLVLDRQLHRKQINQQEALIDDLNGRIDWLANNIELANMGPDHRSRKDVRQNLTWVRADFMHWRDNEINELRQLNSSMCVETPCSITFDTSSLKLFGAINDVGVMLMTSGGTEVAVFTFNSIILGPEVHVTVVGQRALALVSRTAAIINTTIYANPGTLGGFQGGGSVARYVNESLIDNPRSIYICQILDYCTIKNNASDPEIITNNVNGPGSGNLRVFPFVVVSSANDIPEIQEVYTRAQAGQTLAGGFTLHFKDFSTPVIPHDVSAPELKSIIEQNLNLFSPDSGSVYPDRNVNRRAGVGKVDVSRSKQDTQEGYYWTITFLSAIGNIDQITVTSYLQGLNASVESSTIRQGNELGGSFTLSFQGYTTPPIDAAESAEIFREKLLKLPSVSTAFVERTDPTSNCDDGLCVNGPFKARGLMWTAYITTNLTHGDLTPTSPTATQTKQGMPDLDIIPHYDSLEGDGASVQVSYGTSTSLNQMASLLSVRSFSLAFGGAGASYGGAGGLGYGINPTGATYNTLRIDDLLGGSGGCMRSIHPFEINSLLGPVTGKGGHGGGAIEIVAANDIVIGTFGKISMRGGDAEQSSEGGGGGGSGGAILLTAGGTINNYGILDVTGGMGGSGGYGMSQYSGGGGGGGRVAFLAQSILPGTVIQHGGMCGAYKIPVKQNVVLFNLSMHMEMLSPLGMDSLAMLGHIVINRTITTAALETVSVRTDFVNNTIHALVVITVTLDPSYGNTSCIPTIQSKFNALGVYRVAEVYILSMSIQSGYFETVIEPTLALPTNCVNNGSEGTFYTETLMTTQMYVAETPFEGAEGTNKALFLSNRENTNTSSGSYREAPFSWNGPIMPFEASRPTRVTYYTRLVSVPGESQKANFGVLFSLISRGEPGLTVSSVIGVFTGDRISHGANFGSAVDEKIYLKRLSTIWEYPTFDEWYKIDIHINWANHTYYIGLNDVIVTQGNPFQAEDIDGLRLSVTRAVDVWFDEIYVGFDSTMDFVCPTTTRMGTSTVAPPQMHWSLEEVSGGGDPYTEYNVMTRHYSHLDVTGSIPLDGNGDIKQNQDIKVKYATGDYPVTQGKLHAGALQYITQSSRSGRTPSDASYTRVSRKGLWDTGGQSAGDGRQFWYTEYNYISDVSATLNGGVAACSTQDFINWRFEGFVFHYANLSEMVYGTNGPFHVERPKVKFCQKCNVYVMWAVMDNQNRSLAMNMVAYSPYEDGPFLFKRSFYPDGNQTRDQVIFVNDENRAVLGRTYYQTVEYVLPESIMFPSWESVKNRDGTVNYRINYLRGVYDIGYDNYHDIFLQRWRNEDIDYQVYCENVLTGQKRNVEAGVYNIDRLNTVCIDPEERKVIVGQGQAGPNSNQGVISLFVSPNNGNNSWWMQTSVPSVQAQPWASNYRDGYCGIRVLDDNHDLNDPDLATFEASSRETCSNIKDNPVHAALPDQLIGVQRIVTTRRAKFMAVSELTDDLMDTTGSLTSFEGEQDSGDLISMIIEMGQYGFGPGSTIGSTFAPPGRSEYKTAVDYQTRFRQYIRNFNDRGLYSLACVIDGICPVDFKTQVNAVQS